MIYPSQFIPNQIAIKIKENGCFTEYCFMYWDGERPKYEFHSFLMNDVICISIPTYTQIIDWLRINYGIHVYVDSFVGEHKYSAHTKAVSVKGYEIIGSPKSYHAEGYEYHSVLNKAIEAVLKRISEVEKK